MIRRFEVNAQPNSGGIHFCSLVFFFQAEDGIRDADVTGVQTCALPISLFLLPIRKYWRGSSLGVIFRFSSAILFTALMRLAMSSIVKPSGKMIRSTGFGGGPVVVGAVVGVAEPSPRPTMAKASAASTPTPRIRPPKAASPRAAGDEDRWRVTRGGRSSTSDSSRAGERPRPHPVLLGFGRPPPAWL